MHRLTCLTLILMAIALTACASSAQPIQPPTSTNQVATITPTYTPLPTLTPTITATPTPTITATPEPQPWKGTLFRDDNYNAVRDPEEDVLEGYTVCVTAGWTPGDKDTCGTTDAEGKFNIPNTFGKAESYITFIDPNKDTPEELTRFIKLVDTRIIPAYNENGVVIPEQNLKYFKYPTQLFIPGGQMQDIGLVKSEPLYTCPVDMSKNGAHISTWYSDSHRAIDIAANYGTHLLSPDKCTVTDLGIDSDGSHALYMRCSFNSQLELVIKHGNFFANEDDTLDWYGIAREKFINEDGTIIKKPVRVKVAKNADTFPRQDLHFYMACTGKCDGTHVHLGFFRIGGGTRPNPLDYFDCQTR